MTARSQSPNGHGAKGAGEVEAPPEVPEPEAPAVETPEAPERRLARLRRRLAGSNNALSRGLPPLISRDRIDEDTWDDFEETPDHLRPRASRRRRSWSTTLRTRFRVDGVSGCAPRRRAILRAELVKLVDPSLDRTLGHRAARRCPR